MAPLIDRGVTTISVQHFQPLKVFGPLPPPILWIQNLVYDLTTPSIGCSISWWPHNRGQKMAYISMFPGDWEISLMPRAFQDHRNQSCEGIFGRGGAGTLLPLHIVCWEWRVYVGMLHYVIWLIVLYHFCSVWRTVIPPCIGYP